MGLFYPPGAARGLPRVVAFPFTFDTPGLDTGVPVYAPQVGDILFDAWLKVDTAWDGTTPHADIGQFSGGDSVGLAYLVANPWSLSNPDNLSDSGGYSYYGSSYGSLANESGYQEQRLVPGVWLTDDPLELIATTSGTTSGVDPGSSQGVATLYLLVARPV